LHHIAHLPVIPILLAYAIAGAIYAFSAPLLDVSDEVRHYAMVEHLAQGRGLPIQDEALNRRIAEAERQAIRPLTYYAQEGSQPPLYYALMAVVALPFDRSDYVGLVWPNPHAKLGRADATNNWNQLIHVPAESFPWRGTALAVMVMRLIGVLLGAATVACTYALARELGAEKPGEGALPLSSLGWQLLPTFAAALVAFNPMFVHIMASVNNDTLATTLSTLALLLGARMIRCGASVRSAIMLSIVLGSAALTKPSGLALAAAVPFFVLVNEAQRAWGRADERRATRTWLFRLTMCLALPAALIAGWWYVRNQMLYGDFTGTTMMARIAGPREVVPSLVELLGEWDGFFKSYWGLFGAVNIPMDLWIYGALQTALIVAGFGLLLLVGDWLKTVRRTHLPPSILNPQSLTLLMLAGAVLVALAALVRWTSLTLASQGRLLFPVIASISIFIALGMARLARFALCDRVRYAQGGLLGFAFALAALTLAAPFVYIQPAYALPQRLPPDHLPALDRQTELLFEDKIRYLGFRVDTPRQRVAPGEVLDVTLYWQALRPLERNYSAFVRLIGKGDVPVHVLDTYPGGGMWQTTLWRPGEIIADRYRLRIDDTLTNTRLAPSTLWLDVGFWDFTAQRFLQTFDPGGRATGRQRYEAASLNVARPAPTFRLAQRFERALLTGVRVEQSAQSISLSLDWLATADFTDDYTTFVQLFDQQGNKLEPQADGRAKNGDFAPRWWRAGDLILNDTYTLALPPEFPPGAYTIKFGLYKADGTRMPAYHLDGSPIGEAALSVPVEVK